MKRITVKLAVPLQSAITILFALSIGIYINLLTTQMANISSNKSTLTIAISKLHWWNALLLLSIILMLLQGYLIRLPTKTLRQSRDALISSILKTACRSIIYPTMTKHIRAIVTLREGSTGLRRTRFSYQLDGDPEMIASYPLEFGVTGEAYKKRYAIAKELLPNHHDTYTENVKDLVLPEIKSILAAPILSSHDANSEPLGVLAFDSTLPLSKIRFHTHEVRHIAQEWADIISQILMETEI